MVFTYEMLYEAWRRTVTASSDEPNRVRFRYYLEYNLYKLLEELETGTFRPAPPRNKTIVYPKKRVAQVPSLRDKIVQHAIYDNGVYDELTRPLVRETSACIKGRGDDYAIRNLKQAMVRYRNKHGVEFYCLKGDIQKYFASIPHERTIELIDRYVPDENVRQLMRGFIAQAPRGLALGLPQSQALANLYLSELDHLCKQELHATYYGRHMDDFWIIRDSEEALQRDLERIRTYVEGIGLTLNAKTCIYRNKVEFLGFRIFFGENGKIVMRLLPQKRRSKRRELKKKLRMVASGEMTAEAFAKSYAGWRAHALRGSCWSLAKAWDTWLTDELGKLGYQLVIYKRSVSVYVKNAERPALWNPCVCEGVRQVYPLLAAEEDGPGDLVNARTCDPPETHAFLQHWHL